MNKKTFVVILMLPLILNACATAKKSTLLGAAIGGAIGGGMGQAHSKNSQGTVVGALIGAGLGSLIGYFGYSEKKKKELKTGPKSKEEENLIPSITKPRIRSYIVPDTIEGNKYIKSHRIFILENPGAWSQD